MFVSVKFEYILVFMASHLLEGSPGQATRLSSGLLKDSISWFVKRVKASKTRQ
jgi:hypothetical protein